jgi:hypothetical protein
MLADCGDNCGIAPGEIRYHNHFADECYAMGINTRFKLLFRPKHRISADSKSKKIGIARFACLPQTGSE